MRQFLLIGILALAGCSPAWARASVKKKPVPVQPVARSAAEENKDVRQAAFEGWLAANGVMMKDASGKIWLLWIDKTGHLHSTPL